MSHVAENFEGRKYYARAARMGQGWPELWQGEWGSADHEGKIDWKPYGTLKQSEADAYASAERMAKYVAAKK